MDAWASDFESWADCDTVCFQLFDRTPHAWSRVRAWSRARAQFKKRAAFALLWGLTVHDRAEPDRASSLAAAPEREAENARGHSSAPARHS